jgi:glycosyltransferase involved in cell wall biosynthesis
MASGLPVVASRLSGIPELVTDGVDGLLVPAGDASALADALERLADDRALAGRLGAAGRATVLRDYDVDRNARLLAERIRTALATPQGRVASATTATTATTAAADRGTEAVA